MAPNRETREGQPLLTVETEATGDSKSTNERGPSLVGSLIRWACRAGTKSFYSALAALDGQVKTFFFTLYCTLFQILCPHCPASWAGSRAGSPVS